MYPYDPRLGMPGLAPLGSPQGGPSFGAAPGNFGGPMIPAMRSNGPRMRPPSMATPQRQPGPMGQMMGAAGNAAMGEGMKKGFGQGADFLRGLFDGSMPTGPGAQSAMMRPPETFNLAADAMNANAPIPGAMSKAPAGFTPEGLMAPPSPPVGSMTPMPAGGPTGFSPPSSMVPATPPVPTPWAGGVGGMSTPAGGSLSNITLGMPGQSLPTVSGATELVGSGAGDALLTAGAAPVAEGAATAAAPVAAEAMAGGGMGAAGAAGMGAMGFMPFLGPLALAGLFGMGMFD